MDTRRRALRAAGWQCLLILVVLMILLAASPDGMVGLVLVLLGLALIGYRIVYAVRNSAPVVLNQLVIETTGGQAIVLNGRDQYQLLELQARIAEAINNPDANFFLTVYAHVGDNITQDGNHNVGKVGW